MEKIRSLKCLNALDLKLLAMVLMLCDHMWATVIPGNHWLTVIGRMAFPIFAFQVVEGYAHTHDFKKYLGRMFVFALISEIPFDLMMSDGIFFPFHQNVMFTFFEALLFLRLMDWAKKKGSTLFFVVIASVSLVLGYYIGLFTFVDYYGQGILMVLVFYIFRDMQFGRTAILLSMIYINCVMLSGRLMDISLFGYSFEFPEQGMAVFALIPIWLYNGKQGPHSKAIQYGCYAFYPAHMLFLFLIRMMIL